ncbi:MAG TPA: YciI family protein [Thermomicrobiales bacterium]|nr:YciI family protein [Thermomicrobiales bacterium]
MRYALLVCEDETVAVSPEERARRFAGFAAFIDEALARGALIGGERLQPSPTATTVRRRDGGLIVADGPFAETREQIGGLFIVDCRDLDEAIDLAARLPAAHYGTVEVRPLREA